MDRPIVFLTGPPGAGKGTQGALLAEKLDVPHLDVGSYLRDNRWTQTPYGTPGEYMERGELVPDDIVNDLVQRATDTSDGVVIDGYPRTARQARFLRSELDYDLVVRLEVEDDELLRRLTGRRIDPVEGETYHVDDERSEAIDERLVQRPEDSREIAEKRIEANRSKLQRTYTVLESSSAFVTVDGSKNPSEVHRMISSEMDKLSQEKKN